MTILEFLTTTSKFSDKLLSKNILLAIIFRDSHIIISLTTKLSSEITELSYAQPTQSLVFLQPAAFSAELRSLESQFLEKIECQLS